MCLCMRLLFLVWYWTALKRVIIYGKIRKITLNGGMDPAQLAHNLVSYYINVCMCNHKCVRTHAHAYMHQI